ncbi:MAG: DUF393 domain-containing protein [Geothrix sp.]|uniref:thiol-disulfide oxidoreductase DCC family protein n=1 Tax=Geothrix sp. TaxID=1962974 RepID=UPI0017A77EC5|nr:DUF393 domain-containing protein [Geothrix sp.]NWJ41400.1 DUF393 domain-containing protein [Geothrix sp.]WIL20613.1 MAG: DUF393 domain-containing protein [Geothrix sp.]
MGSDQGLTHLFYDGGCGLCQRAVRFVAGRDRSGRVRFAPLGGEAFHRLIPGSVLSGLPDSLLVRTPDGALWSRSGALIHLLGRMGPGWRLAGMLLAWLPGGLRDGAYDWVARRRQRITACAWRPGPSDPRFEA